MPGILPRLKNLIGRYQERALVQAAIEAKWRAKWNKLFSPEQIEKNEIALKQQPIVLHFWGKGGIGKTRLLQGVDAIQKNCNPKTPCLYGGFVDLYDVALHDARELERKIVARLTQVPRAKNAFAKYTAKDIEFQKLQAKAHEGVPASVLADARKDLTDTFVADFNALSRQNRIVLCLDTIELLQHEQSKVEEICGRLWENVESHDWLLTVIPRLENVVVILSSRPQTNLQADLAMQFGPALISHEMKGFVSSNETHEYFAALKKDSSVTKALENAKFDADVAHRYTDGHPLLLSILADLAVYGGKVPDVLTDPIELAETRSDDELKEIASDLRKELAERAMGGERGGDDLWRALPYLAWARKGIDARMLRQILGWKKDRAEKLWARLHNEKTRPSFVKVHAESSQVFLHDEMYRLVDDHLADKLVGPRQQVCETLIKYYQERLDKSKGKQRQRLQVEQLYYKMLDNPYQGYLAFGKLADAAAIGHEVEFLTNLETELLRFFPVNEIGARVWERVKRIKPNLTPDRVERGFAIRSVRRLLAETRYAKAEQVAEQLENSTLISSNDPHFVWFLRAFRGEAMCYTKPGDPATFALLDQAKNFLLDNPRDDERGEYLRQGTLGRIYNDLGYLFDAQGRLADSKEAYCQALKYYERVDLPGQKADTLRNLADVYARTGQLNLAEDTAIESKANSEKADNTVGTGLSFNVIARIELARNYPRRALGYSNSALKSFLDAKDIRDEGLARITLGNAHRKIVGLEIKMLVPADADSNMEASVAHFDRAEEIFTTQIKDERFRLIDVYGSRGCTWRDWVTYLRRRGENGRSIDTLSANAKTDFQKAVNIARELRLLVAEADVRNDEAELYFYAGELERVKELLDQSDKLIPADHLIVASRGMPTPAGKSVLEFWQVLGKNHLVRSRVGFVQEQYEMAIENYLLACLYFQKYSADPISFVRRDVRDEVMSNLGRLPEPRTEKLVHLADFVHTRAEYYGVAEEEATRQVLALLKH